MKRIETSKDWKRVQIKAGEAQIGDSILVEKEVEELGGALLLFKIEKLGSVFDGVDKDGDTFGKIPVQYAYGDIDIKGTATKVREIIPEGFDDAEALALAVESVWVASLGMPAWRAQVAEIVRKALG